MSAGVMWPEAPAPHGTFAERFAERALAGAGDPGDSQWLCWDVGGELLGAFGGLFGGLVAAMAARAAKLAAPGRDLVGLDVVFERPLLPGSSTAGASVRRIGRSLAVVDAVVTGPDGNVAARAVAMLTDPAALRDLDEPGPGKPVAPWVDYEDAVSPMGARELMPPLVHTLEPRSAVHDDGWVSSIVRLPWDVTLDPATAAEAACFAGDVAVGTPVARHILDRWGPHPNPDLSLRLATRTTPQVVAGTARLARIGAGVAVTQLEIMGPDGVLGVGSSCSLLLGER